MLIGAVARTGRSSLFRELRTHHWSPVERTVLISGIAILMGCLFVTAYMLALRNAVYFQEHQHLQPIAVLITWALALFTAMVIESRRSHESPGVS